jgi:hypothetical protein
MSAGTEDENERIRLSIVAFNLVLGAIMIVAFVTHSRLVV